ncbi:Cysteine-rich membrane protein 1 [Spironucleus salmonicida]|uniref:Cysteine-rich membrane protein 1 n=2 Tax=Spironucleus salmonicida TaxID=348837 RepID=A0A9P8LPK0_9EUKA|nr:Cysteine-rich membrane protein 1 [Spironucleus salmonicida]
MTAKTYCSVGNNVCNRNYYCPASGVLHETCQKCSRDIQIGQGCNCLPKQSYKNCIACSGYLCSECLPGFYTDLISCEKCKAGCKECTSERSCTACEDGYIFNSARKICTPKCFTNTDCMDRKGKYCNLITNQCESCGPFCQWCISPSFCYSCISDQYTLTISGICEMGCLNLQNGEYCKEGKAEPCFEGCTSACKCGEQKNCATCSLAGYCTSCLPHYQQDMFGACTQCSYGYEMLDNFCIPSYLTHWNSGTCSRVDYTCKAGFYCPATSNHLVQCLPCREDMKFGDSCYCLDNVPTQNCIECANGNCTRIMIEQADTSPHTKRCLLGCSQCNADQRCLKCDDTHVLDYSNHTCSFCDENQFIITTSGLCTPKCENLPVGYYCKNGKPELCTEDSTSMCSCGVAKNCALCNPDNNTCKQCLNAIHMDYTGICVKPADWELEKQQAGEESADEHSAGTFEVGAYLGVIAAVLALISCVCITAYIVVKKARKSPGVVAISIY